MTVTRKNALRALLAASLVPGSAIAQSQGNAQKRDLSKGNTLYVVPYAHLDTQWRWAYPQVIREYIWATMADNLALIEKYPNYVFNFSGSRRYEMMREYYPAEYAKVVAAIKAGRWFPCGSSVDEGDANVPSGEALIRHVLYGNRFFRQNFGVASQEFMLPDCFGFPYALPTLLKHCGLSGFSTQKLTWGSSVGIPFKVGNWEGPDGQTIVAALDPGAYTGEVREDLSQNSSWLARIQNTGKMSGAYVDYHYYGTGDRGGAPGENSVKWVEQSIAGKGPISVVSTRADEMFMSLTPQQTAKLPKYKGELLLTEHSAGSITSQAHMKRWNRKNELLADAAERASVAAMWLGKSYPAERLYNAWDLVLGSQMHDMLPGTSLPRAYDFCYNDELLALNQFAAITEDSVGTVSSQLDTRANGTPVVVYNPLAIAREDVVEAFVPASYRGVQVYGPDGKAVPTQVVGTENGKLKVLFLAKVLPSGFATYDARPSTARANSGSLKVSGRTLENERFVVKLNAAGDIASIYDKVNKREALKAPARLDFQHHNPDQYPAWNMDWNDQNKPPYAQLGGGAKFRVVENGPVRVTIEVERKGQGSKFVQRVSLSAAGAGDRVEVENVIDWQTRETALKAAFPLTTANPKATYDLQVGAIERGNNDPKKYEVPQHQWLDLTAPDGKYGVAILNDSKFGSDKPSDDTVRLTLLYTPGVRGGYQDQATQDFGRHSILYAIAPHAGDWRKGDVAWNAKRLNQPLRAFSVPAHAGSLGKNFSMVQSSNRNIEVQALKRAEDGDGVVVRVRELSGSPSKGLLGFAGPVVAVQELDGQERPLGSAKLVGGKVAVDVRGYGLRTYRVRFGKAPAKVATTISKAVPLAYNLDVASTDKNDRDGAFDAQGRSYPAEQLPKKLDLNGVQFRLGPTNDGAKNAVVAKGQRIALPAGYKRVYVLAAATQDVNATFRVGTKSQSATVPAWDGFVGLWDTREWSGVVPELAYGWDNPFAGLVPGFTKKAEVAWYASHRHLPGKGNGYYEYSYLFKKAFDIPAGATSLTLPNDPRVRVFAVSVAKDTLDNATPTAPLYDTLDDHRQVDAPEIVAPSGSLKDATSVRIVPPLYWNQGRLRYTTDGSVPTLSSPEYKEPIVLDSPTTLRAAEIGANGKPGPVATMKIDVRDVTAPSIVSGGLSASLGFGTITFSERVDKASAENAANYKLTRGRIDSAKLAADGRTVELAVSGASGNGSLTVDGVRDSVGNVTKTDYAIGEILPAFTAPALEKSKTANFNAPVPTAADAPWTLNFWVKLDKQPEDRTLIAGFGRATDGRAGTGRYMAKFSTGLQFWIANQDVVTNTPLDVNKWQMLTATYDGTTVRVYKNGVQVGSRESSLGNDVARANVFPTDAWDRRRKAEGEVRDFTVWNQALSAGAIAKLYGKG